MSIAEPQTAEPISERPPFQYSLRSLFGLTCATAAFFSLARALGYVDAVVILAGIAVVVGFMGYPRRVHPATGILLTLVAGTLLWANLRPNASAREFGAWPPDRLDPLAKSMFCRGWPIPPFMFCLYHHMTVDPNDPTIYVALVIDGVVFVVALFVVKGVCELYFQWRARWAIKTLSDLHPQGDPPSAGSTLGPPVE